MFGSSGVELGDSGPTGVKSDPLKVMSHLRERTDQSLISDYK